MKVLGTLIVLCSLVSAAIGWIYAERLSGALTGFFFILLPGIFLIYRDLREGSKEGTVTNNDPPDATSR